ncbi:hypothetical protein ACFFRR_006830 [Megaselia abdita]
MEVDTEAGATNLTAEALKRKERLQKMRNLATGKTDGKKADENLPKPIFRSYRPKDESLMENSLEQKTAGDIEKKVEEQLELAKTPLTIEDIDISNLAPRKPDWDLKRDLSKKLEILERRTQKAIAELIRERLKENQEDIFQAVNVGSSIMPQSQEDDD